MDKSWPEQWQHLQDPAFRQRLLSERGEPTGSDLQLIADLMESAFSMQYEMQPGFDYEPSAEQSVEARARASGVSAEEYAYDFMMRNGGTGMLYFPLLELCQWQYGFFGGGAGLRGLRQLAVRRRSTLRNHLRCGGNHFHASALGS